MEEWEKHYHMSTGSCFEMFFTEYDGIIKFKVIGSNSDGDKKALNCDTHEEFTFNREQLIKVDYSTLREIDCENC